MRKGERIDIVIEAEGNDTLRITATNASNKRSEVKRLGTWLVDEKAPLLNIEVNPRGLEFNQRVGEGWHQR